MCWRGNCLENTNSVEKEQSKWSVTATGFTASFQYLPWKHRYPTIASNTHMQTDEHTWYYHTCTCNYVYTYRCGSRYGNKVTQSCTGCGFTQILAGTHTFLPISSHIYQCGVRDDLERLSVLIISLDSWSAAAVKNETAISWPPVLLIRKRTIPNHRMDWTWCLGGKHTVCVCACMH